MFVDRLNPPTLNARQRSAHWRERPWRKVLPISGRLAPTITNKSVSLTSLFALILLFYSGLAAAAADWSSETQKYLNDPKPLRPDTDRMPLEQRTAVTRAVVSELSEGFEAFMAPVTSGIEALVSDLTLSMPFLFVQVATDRTIEPWEPFWNFKYTILSEEKTDDRVAYTGFPRRAPDEAQLFVLELGIFVGSSREFVAQNVGKYDEHGDESFIDENLYETEAYKAYAEQLKAGREAAKKAAIANGVSRMLAGAYRAHTHTAEPIDLGQEAVVHWDIESRYATVKWHRAAHTAELSVVAPDTGLAAKDYAIRRATEIDKLLQDNGFYDFPLSSAEHGDTPDPGDPGDPAEATAKVLSVELLDANPLFSPDGKTLSANLRPAELFAADTARKGTTGDGVSQLILRAEVSDGLPVQFSVGNPDDGTITPLLDGRTITSKDRHFAFALYTPPDLFRPPPEISAKPKSPLVPPDRRLGDVLEVRDILVSMQIGDTGRQETSLLLAQPPVVLVHGLFSDPIQTWVKTFENGASMTTLLERAGFLPFLVNYQNSNGRIAVSGKKSPSFLLEADEIGYSGFSDNARVVWDSPQVDYTPVRYDYGLLSEAPIYSELQKPRSTRIGGISQALTYYRDTLGLASTQAIVVGHSMGGILARVWASEAKEYNPTYRRPENFWQGDIDRLLTLNTPHFGSELVELKDAFLNARIKDEDWTTWAERQVVTSLVWWFLEPESGALRDLRPVSAALQLIGETKVPSYAIATWYDESDAYDLKNDPFKHYRSLYDFVGTIFFNNRPLLDDFLGKRAAAWKHAPLGLRVGTDSSGQQGVDFADPEGVQSYTRTFEQGMDDASYYWATTREKAHRDKLRAAIRDTVIVPFGLVDWSMGDDDELDMLTQQYLSENGLALPAPNSDFETLDQAKTPVAFLAMLRHLVFHNDAMNDGAVRVESQTGGLGENASEVIPHVIHSYSPWAYPVQTRVLSLLRFEGKRFDPGGFKTAGRLLPRYLPSSALSDARVFGSEAIAWSGMVPSHAKQYLDAADRKDAFILVRPVNPASTRLLAANAAAKGMNVKGKSSNWGPQVGLIPVDQRYSKIWRTVNDPNRRRDEIKKYNSETQSSITTPYPANPERKFAVPQALTRVQTLEEGKCDVVTNPAVADADAEAAVLFHCKNGFFKWQNGAKNGKAVFDPAVKLTPVTLSPEDAAIVLDNPMMVLADGTSDVTPRPNLTADYDLLAIGFRFEPWQCESGDTPQPGDVVRCTPAPSRAVAKIMETKKFDKLRGYIGPEQWRLVSEINEAVRVIAGYSGGLVTHHGPENQYPKSPYVDYPVLVFDPMEPNETGDAQAYLIRMGPPGFRDIHLKRFFAEKNRLGYNLWPNSDSAAWRWTAWREFDMALGYDPRDAANLPPYVKEASPPDIARIEQAAMEFGAVATPLFTQFDALAAACDVPALVNLSEQIALKLDSANAQAEVASLTVLRDQVRGRISFFMALSDDFHALSDAYERGEIELAKAMFGTLSVDMGPLPDGPNCLAARADAALIARRIDELNKLTDVADRLMEACDVPSMQRLIVALREKANPAVTSVSALLQEAVFHCNSRPIEP
jgi:pimeloyl-ACP methyl ester carboxylesterase